MHHYTHHSPSWITAQYYRPPCTTRQHCRPPCTTTQHGKLFHTIVHHSTQCNTAHSASQHTVQHSITTLTCITCVLRTVLSHTTMHHMRTTQHHASPQQCKQLHNSTDRHASPHSTTCYPTALQPTMHHNNTFQTTMQHYTALHATLLFLTQLYISLCSTTQHHILLGAHPAPTHCHTALQITRHNASPHRPQTTMN
jgi:hypothetical protein